MTATDELRRMLDERGVRWKRVRGHKDNGTSWHDVYGSYVEAVQEYAWDGGEFPEGKMVVRRGPAYMTPEQAIAATLGADAKPTQAESSGTCEMEYVSDWMSWHCKACDQMDMAPRDPKPRYCKWCGRKVVGE